MIKLTIHSSNLTERLLKVSNSIKELIAPTVLQEIAKVAFVVTGERFVLDVDKHAVQNPKKMHHVYEWGKIGSPEGRLFVIERLGILGGNLIVGYSFLPSKLPVPIPAELLSPGATGRTVTKQNIFRDKASVMEEGRMISYTTNKMLAFLGNNGLMFKRPGDRVEILNPGGLEVKNAFADYMIEWYTEHPNLIMQRSGLYEALANEAAIAITEGAGIAGVRKVASNLSNSMGGNIKVIR
jgi:hypothetical protein